VLREGEREHLRGEREKGEGNVCALTDDRIIFTRGVQAVITGGYFNNRNRLHFRRLSDFQ
jgi:hypothetical protein